MYTNFPGPSSVTFVIEFSLFSSPMMSDPPFVIISILCFPYNLFEIHKATAVAMAPVPQANVS